jgi:type III secretion protein Q
VVAEPRNLCPDDLTPCKPAALELVQAAFAQPHRILFLAGNATCALRFEASRSLSGRQLQLRLDVDGEPLQVAVSAGPGLEELLLVPDRDVPDWLLAPWLFDALVRPLCAAAFDLHASSVEPAPGPPLQTSVPLMFSVDAKQATVHGCLFASPMLAQTMAQALHRHRSEPRRSLDHLPVTLPLHLAGPLVTVADLASLAIGDWVRLPPPAADQPRVEWRRPGCVTAAGVLLPLPDLSHNAWNSPMNNPLSSPDRHSNAALAGAVDAAPYPADTTADTTVDPLATLPISLSFVIGHLEVALSLLRSVQPGYVLPLDQQVATARVSLLANGQAFGSGELLALGDRLAVRVVSLSDPTAGRSR